MISLPAALGYQLLIFSPFYLIMAIVTFAFVRLCVNWKAGQVLCGIVLLGFSAGLIYGLLRAAGVILYPNEDVRAWSGYFYDTKFRTEGVRLAAPCAVEMAAILIAGWSGIRTKATQQMEE